MILKGISAFLIISILLIVTLINDRSMWKLLGMVSGETQKLDFYAQGIREQIQTQALISIPPGYFVLISPCDNIDYSNDYGWEVPEDAKSVIRKKCFASDSIVCLMVPKPNTALIGCRPIPNTEIDRTYFFSPQVTGKTFRIIKTGDTISLA